MLVFMCVCVHERERDCRNARVMCLHGCLWNISIYSRSSPCPEPSLSTSVSKKLKIRKPGRPTGTCQIICLYLRPLVVTVMLCADASQQFEGALSIITHMMAQYDNQLGSWRLSLVIRPALIFMRILHNHIMHNLFKDSCQVIVLTKCIGPLGCVYFVDLHLLNFHNTKNSFDCSQDVVSLHQQVALLGKTTNMVYFDVNVKEG